MKNNLVKIIDSIPIPTPEQGDNAVNLALAFVAGFIFAILVLESDMGYAVIGERNNRWQPRVGLEGPFYFATGRVLYYDVQEGSYWDPLTDFYVPNDEVAELHGELARMLSR